MFVDNDASDYVSVHSDGEQHRLYKQNNTLTGVVKVDLSKIKWDKNYVPSQSNSDRKHVNDLNYTEQHFLTDLKDFNSSKIHFSQYITFLDEDGNEIELFDDVESGLNENGFKIISLENNIFTFSLFNEYNAGNISYDVSNAEDYVGDLSEAPESEDISAVKILLSFDTDDSTYHVDVDLTGDDFKLVHR